MNINLPAAIGFCSQEQEYLMNHALFDAKVKRRTKKLTVNNEMSGLCVEESWILMGM